LFQSVGRDRVSTGRVLAVLPAGLVPLAWGFTAAVVVGAVGREALLVGLGVMTTLFAVFAVQPAMGEGVLADWRAVIVGGFLANLLALADLLFVFAGDPLVPVAVYAWMLLPAAAAVRTGRAVGAATRYAVFAGLSVAGAGVVAVSAATGGVAGVDATTQTLVGLGLVALGQTGSILDAVVRNGGAALGDTRSAAEG
jgi:hypothetical protein